MHKIKGYQIGLQGSSYELGKQQAVFYKENPKLLVLQDKEFVNDITFNEIRNMFDEFCPGLNEEIAGFCDALKISPKQIIYYNMTWLNAGCSHCAILPGLTSDGHIYVLRNYDFSDTMDDHRLCSTNVTGRYAHTGFSLALFARTEGMNVHGLCITNSSSGIPVGQITGLRRPVKSGLQFWAVTRTLLEQCSNVIEAVQLIKEMPITYNLNMILTDSLGNVQKVEMLEDRTATYKLSRNDPHQFLAATNHGVLPEITSIEPKKMKHSLVRYNLIQQYFTRKPKYSKEDIKRLVELEYPNGLTVHFYQQFFGTLRSILFNVSDKALDVCFGSPLFNQWQTLKVGEILPFKEIEITLENKQCATDFGSMVD